MSKNIQIKLLKIEYSGDSIGDDICIEVEHPGGLWSLDKKIKNKSDATIEKIVYQFIATQNIQGLPLNVKVIEKDLVFNDVGSIKVDLAIDLDDFKPQVSSHEIMVKELRGVTPGSKKAIFTLTLEVLVSENICYIPITEDGWFGYYNSNKVKTSLPSYLKLHFDKTESNKEYFTVMEGVLQGMQFWSSAGREELSFINKNPQTDPINLIYSISTKTLKLNNKKYLTTDSPNVPWEKGVYDIEIPDYPHGGGLRYSKSKYATVWFRIGHNGDRYLHTGAHSLGCMTLTEVEKWDEIFKILIKARKGDNKSVGTIQIVD